MLLPVVLAVASLEDLINDTLDFDAGSRQRLNALRGRSVLLQVEFPRLDLLLFLDEDRVRLTPQEGPLPTPADATVGASSFTFLRRLLQLQEPFSIGELRVQGDVLLLQELHGIARDLDIDWEQGLARLVGDSAAQQLGQGLRGLFRAARDMASVFLQEGGRYLQSGGQMLPARGQVEDFIEGVQELHSGIERLQARVQRLQAARANRQDGPAA